MVFELSVKELDRDDHFGVIKKRVSLPNGPSFTTPNRSLKQFIPPESYQKEEFINEVTEQIGDDKLASIETGAASSNSSAIRSKFIKNKLNLTLFHLQFDAVPENKKLITLAHYMYSASESTLVLPTVKTSLLQENGKYSEKRVKLYIEMMDKIIDEINVVGNHKVIIGMVPLFFPIYSREIIEFYQKKQISAFAIDAGTKDVFLHEADFRIILSAINSNNPLHKTLLLGYNLGVPQFEKYQTRADDFLSLFAYLDIFGSTFRRRGGGGSKKDQPARSKIFSRNDYSYTYSTISEAKERFKFTASNMNINALKNFNQVEQLSEVKKVQGFVGEESLISYLQTKSAVDSNAISKLQAIAANVKTE